MWVIIVSGGDADYTDVYGPFTTENEAEEKAEMLPADTDDISYRVKKVDTIADLDERIEEEKEYQTEELQEELLESPIVETPAWYGTDVFLAAFERGALKPSDITNEAFSPIFGDMGAYSDEEKKAAKLFATLFLNEDTEDSKENQQVTCWQFLFRQESTMSTPTKCSKPKGQYCRLHNPAPTVASLEAEIAGYKKKVQELLATTPIEAYDMEAELERVKDKLNDLTGGSISIEHDTHYLNHDVFNITFNAEHDLTMFVAYPNNGEQPIRGIDYGFITRNKVYPVIPVEEFLTELNLSELADENPYYPGNISVYQLDTDKRIRLFYEEKYQVKFYSEPVNGNVRIKYDTVDWVNAENAEERTKITETVVSFFKKLDAAKGYAWKS